jgi:Ca2+-binding RTX toxin-like protein
LQSIAPDRTRFFPTNNRTIILAKYLILSPLQLQSIGKKLLDINLIEKGKTTNMFIPGTPANDSLVGTINDDIILGFAGDDILRGLEGNDSINGGKGEDVIRGGEGNDTINGGSDNDNLGGGKGNDWVSGGKGDDLIVGVAPAPPIGSNPGAGEMDILTGGLGSDRFSLGDQFEAYYDDQGGVDFAVITDLSILDTIVLNGQASDYVVQNHAAFIPELGGLVQGTGIFKKEAGGKDLIGIAQNIFGLNLNSSVFQFVDNDLAP